MTCFVEQSDLLFKPTNTGLLGLAVSYSAQPQLKLEQRWGSELALYPNSGTSFTNLSLDLDQIDHFDSIRQTDN